MQTRPSFPLIGLCLISLNAFGSTAFFTFDPVHLDPQELKPGNTVNHIYKTVPWNCQISEHHVKGHGMDIFLDCNVRNQPDVGIEDGLDCNESEPAKYRVTLLKGKGEDGKLHMETVQLYCNLKK